LSWKTYFKKVNIHFGLLWLGLGLTTQHHKTGL